MQEATFLLCAQAEAPGDTHAHPIHGGESSHPCSCVPLQHNVAQHTSSLGVGLACCTEGLRSDGELDLRLKANGGLGAGGEEAAGDELVQAALVGVPHLVGVRGGPPGGVDRRVGVVIVAATPRRRPHLSAVYTLRVLPPTRVVQMLPHERLQPVEVRLCHA